MPVAAIGAIAVAGAVASAAAKKKAAKNAASAQKKGIEQQEALLRTKLDPAALNRLAQEVDRERAQNRIQLQKEVDPEIAQLREFSRKKLLDLSQQEQSSLQSQQVANQLFRENIEADPNMERLKDTIIASAQKEFDAGATLPPEFQAELVRTGLQTGAQSGIGTGKTSVGGVTSRLLGGAGIQLQQQRQQQGAALAGTADSLARSRQQLLANIFPTVKVQEDAALQRAQGGLALSEAMLPESGLSGLDATNIEVARRKGQAGLLGQRAAIKAGEAQARGDFTASLIGAGTSLATAGIGALPLGGAGAVAPVTPPPPAFNYPSLAASVAGGVSPYSYQRR